MEVDINGKVLDDTEEIVAEYAVDLNLQVTAVTSTTGCCDPNLTQLPPSDPQFPTFTGPVFGFANTPELIRSVRVRLGVRSREADRDASYDRAATDRPPIQPSRACFASTSTRRARLSRAFAPSRRTSRFTIRQTFYGKRDSISEADLRPARHLPELPVKASAARPYSSW